MQRLLLYKFLVYFLCTLLAAAFVAQRIKLAVKLLVYRQPSSYASTCLQPCLRVEGSVRAACWLPVCVCFCACASVCVSGCSCLQAWIFLSSPPLCLSHHCSPCLTLSLSPSSSCSLCNNSADLVSVCSGLLVEFYRGLPVWLKRRQKTMTVDFLWCRIITAN